MSERPALEKSLTASTFRNYYYLKEELVAFCKANSLSSSGGKIELSDRIAHYLDTGEILRAAPQRKAPACVTMRVDTIDDKKQGKTTIDRQFEYNTYIRAFFAGNKGRTLQDAIHCWKHKRSLPGHNRYEKEDLVALASV